MCVCVRVGWFICVHVYTLTPTNTHTHADVDVGTDTQKKNPSPLHTPNHTLWHSHTPERGHKFHGNIRICTHKQTHKYPTQTHTLITTPSYTNTLYPHPHPHNHPHLRDALNLHYKTKIIVHTHTNIRPHTHT